jgi:hypothetical protein
MIQWSGRTTALVHKSDRDWKEQILPSDVKAGLRQVAFRSARSWQTADLESSEVEAPTGYERVWFLDAQWSTCPVEVEAEVQRLWAHRGLGNENEVLETSLADLQDCAEGGAPRVDAIAQWVREQAPTLDDEDPLVIHWWW